MNATEMTLKQMAETIKNRWREKSPGGCRMLSRGNDCNCTLCLVGNLFAAATADAHITPAILEDSLPGFLKMEVEAMPDFWAEYADNVRNRLRATVASWTPEVDVPPKRGKHTNTSDGYCEICRPAKR
jgi:hypothetical protein